MIKAIVEPATLKWRRKYDVLRVGVSARTYDEAVELVTEAAVGSRLPFCSQHGSPTFTKDVAWATQEVLTKPEQYPPGIYHTVNFGETTWYGFTKTVFLS